MVFIALGTDAFAQCQMCKMGAESNLNAGGASARGLNKGILFMLATPYLIVGGLGYAWWRNRKKQAELQGQNEL